MLGEVNRNKLETRIIQEEAVFFNGWLFTTLLMEQIIFSGSVYFTCIGKIFKYLFLFF
jgi:hypothetical protein